MAKGSSDNQKKDPTYIVDTEKEEMDTMPLDNTTVLEKEGSKPPSRKKGASRRAFRDMTPSTNNNKEAMVKRLEEFNACDIKIIEQIEALQKLRRELHFPKLPTQQGKRMTLGKGKLKGEGYHA